MKKTINKLFLATLIVNFLFLISLPAQASATNLTTSKTTASTNKTTTKAKTVTKPAVKITPVKWATSGLKSIARIPSGVRPAYKKKVENYARRNNIKLITATVVNNMRE